MQHLPAVLIADDDPFIRHLLQHCLEGKGFHTLVAADGGEALALFALQRDAIDLVLLDVRMPVLDGPKTLDALRRINPAVRCCFMSGDLGGYGIDDLRARGALRLFDKPFSIKDLAEALMALVKEK